MAAPNQAVAAPHGNAAASSLALAVRELLALQGIAATEAQARGVAKTLIRLAPPPEPRS